MLLLLLVLLCTAAFCAFCAALNGNLLDAVYMVCELGCSLLPWVLILWAAGAARRRQGVRLMVGTRWLWMALFGLYLTLALLVTGAGTLEEVLWNGTHLCTGELNLRPFSRGIDPVGYLLNVILGMPLGFLLPLLWDRLDRPGAILCAGLGFSLLVELSQLCNLRATDIDDVLMNTLGTVLGFWGFRLFARVTQWKRETVLQWPVGPAATVLVLFLGRFFLWRSCRLAELLYG